MIRSAPACSCVPGLILCVRGSWQEGGIAGMPVRGRDIARRDTRTAVPPAYVRWGTSLDEQSAYTRGRWEKSPANSGWPRRIARRIILRRVTAASAQTLRRRVPHSPPPPESAPIQQHWALSRRRRAPNHHRISTPQRVTCPQAVARALSACSAPCPRICPAAPL